MTAETKEVKLKRSRPTKADLQAKKLEEAKAVVIEDAKGTVSGFEVKRDDRGLILPGSASPNLGKRRGSVAARIEVAFPNILEYAADVATGKIRASREQVTMLRDLMDRRFGRSPETHIVGAMDSEQREAAAALTKEQLLGLLDAGSGPLATETATNVVEGSVVTEETT